MRSYNDCETKSLLDLKLVGAAKYSEHYSTDVICWAYTHPNMPGCIFLWIPGVHSASDLRDLALDPQVKFVAHNAFFERMIWANVMVKRYGFPPLPIDKWLCTMAKAWAHGLPGKLEDVAAVLELKHQKDMAGNKAMKLISKPKTQTQQLAYYKANLVWGSPFWTPQEKPEAFGLTYGYCIGDVGVTEELDHRLRDLSPEEQRVWQADQRMNTDGIMLDMAIVNRVREWIDIANAQIHHDFQAITGIERPTMRDQFIDWLADKGYKIENTQKDTIKKLLTRCANPVVRQAIELFQAGTKSSLAKYEAAHNLATVDGLLREILAYHAAHTGRYGGRGVQVQNLSRPDGFDIDLAIQTLGYGYNFFRWSYEC